MELMHRENPNLIKKYFPGYSDCLLSKKDAYLRHAKGSAATILDPSFFIDMANGEVVIILDTNVLKKFETLHSSQKEKYSVSEHKYSYKVFFHIKNKKSLVRKQMKFG